MQVVEPTWQEGAGSLLLLAAAHETGLLEALERRLANIQRWAPKAHERAERASRLAERLWQETKAHGDALYRRINTYICEHDRGDEREWRLQHQGVVKAMKAEADADLAERWRCYERVRDRDDREESKYTRYCLEQCDLLRALAELEAKERAMYELENGKDQTMTVLKLALANLGMWVREQYFPATYAHATWHRLAPFFRLAGRVTEGKQIIWVELRPFNDCQLTRDLQALCERVAAAHPCLPDGRRLCYTIAGRGGLRSAGQHGQKDRPSPKRTSTSVSIPQRNGQSDKRAGNRRKAHEHENVVSRHEWSNGACETAERGKA